MKDNIFSTGICQIIKQTCTIAMTNCTLNYRLYRLLLNDYRHVHLIIVKKIPVLHNIS